MSEQQRLFEHYNPIEKRVGQSFFEELPTDAGIYKMYGSKKDLLYVGKAKNLRNRLFTYRRAKMSTTTSKTIRLIRMTHNIDIEICNTEKEALLLENKLIREHQPEFNYAKKQPQTYYFIGLQRLDDRVEFSLQMSVPDKEFVFGAFKGHRLVRKTMGGLIRMLYVIEHRVDSVFQLPSILTQKLTPMEYDLKISPDGKIDEVLWPTMIDYFKGLNNRVLGQVLEICKERGLLESFAGSMILDDLDSMKWFYERCSRRNFQIYQQLELKSVLIPQEKLDDLYIEWAFFDENEYSDSEE